VSDKPLITGPVSHSWVAIQMHALRRTGGRCVLLIASVACLPAQASNCEPAAKTVFSCFTKAGKQIQVCDAGSTIDYAFGTPARKPELVIRAPRATASTFQWLGVGRSMTYTVEVPNGDTKYIVFWSADRLDARHPVDAGVRVERNGTELATVRCIDNAQLVQAIEGIDLKKSE
jgi:hypothetical protein